MFDFWIIAIASLCAIAAALPGCFLVLRKMSMMGDAISHAVLPGIAVAFLASGSRASLPIFIGAVLAGLLATLLTELIHRGAKVDPGAAMGVVFTSLFALGLVLITRASETGKIDLDPSCVLYGALELAPLDQAHLFGRPLWFLGSPVPRALLINAAVALTNLGFILLMFKELRLASFDPSLADTLGFRSRLLHYLLMILVAITTVAAFETVGSIIVIAMFVVPAASALLLTRRLATMLPLSSAFGVAAVLLGHLGALKLPPLLGYPVTRTSGMIAVAAGLLFLLAWFWHQASERGRRIANPPEQGQNEIKVSTDAVLLP